MSMRYQAGIVLPGYNALKVPNAPTIGTATGGNNSASVTFTAPADTGGGAITGYSVVSTPGEFVGTGASSPVTVSGLTNGTAYTFKVWATNAYGPSSLSAASNSATPVEVTGQQAYTTAGTYSWVAPAGVTKVSVVAVGGGGNGALRFLCSGVYQICGSGGGGGGLGYKNNYTVIPGNSYTVQTGGANTNSFFVCTAVVTGGAGGTGSGYSGGSGGTYTGDGGGNGGNGCTDGAGGAGGYAGNGGRGGGNGSGLSGSGGGAGGGGGGGGLSGAGGGGVGILGQGSNGAGGAGGVSPNVGGGAGSSGSAGSNSSTSTNAPGGAGGAYGGGGGGGAAVYTGSTVGAGGVGAVRIIWPGTTRSFPSTNTGNL